MSGTPVSAVAVNATNITLTLTASDLPKSLHFYTEGLGFEVGQRYEVEGVLQYVTVSSGGCEIGIGRDDFAKGRDRAKGVGSRIWIWTSQDLDAVAARAKSAGIVLDSEPAPLDWGGSAFTLTDPDGFKITVRKD